MTEDKKANFNPFQGKEKVEKRNNESTRYSKKPKQAPKPPNKNQ